MADKKITQLTNITGADLADADEFVVVDITSDETKAITFNELKTAFDTGTGFVRVTGDTMTGALNVESTITSDGMIVDGDVTFGDDDKAIFGAGSDLQIYHDGTTSIIKETGSGDLRLQGANIDFKDLSGQTYAYFNDTSGAVSLYHNNAVKLSTTSTGIDVTGTVTADGLTLGDGEYFYAGSGADLKIGHDGTESIVRSQGAPLNIDANGTTFRGYSPYTKHMNIASNGDISFYEDTGTTAKFFWDSSEESLGIGTSPTSTLHIKTSVDNSVSQGLVIERSANTDRGYINYQGGAFQFRSTVGDPIVFGDTSDEQMRLTSTGLGIGTSSPSATLQAQKGSNGEYLRVGGDDQSDGNRGLRFTSSSSANFVGAVHDINAPSSQGAISFSTGSSEAMRIDSSGNVGIGTDSPSSKIDIGTTDSTLYSDSSSTGQAGIGATLQLTNLATVGNAVSQILFKMNNERVINRIVSSYTTTTDGYLAFVTEGAGTPAERMRINSSGNLLVGKTALGSSAVGIELRATNVIDITRSANACLNVNRIGSSAGPAIIMHYDGVDVGSIDVADGSTSYTTSSDYRLKTDAQPMTGASARVQALNPVNFEWISDGTRVDGFLAHEAQVVVPEAITGTKDAMKDEEYEVTPAVLDDDGNVTTEAVMGTRSVPDYQGIDQSKLVPLLTAALQEALTEIASLKTRVEALEG